jgi:hypothetical protein
MNDSLQLAEILSWRIMTEIWRRVPDRYGVIEMHPGGGMYDCLTLWNTTKSSSSPLSINRGGSLNVDSLGSTKSWPDWINRMLEDPKDFVTEVARKAGLPEPIKLPKSAASTVTFRFITDFLTHSIGRLEHWECRNGFCDSSGYGGGVRSHWFEKFPGIQPGLKRGEEASLWRWAIQNTNTGFFARTKLRNAVST